MALNPTISNWTGRRVWMVGASSGIGKATASALHAQGAHVIVSARNQAALDEFVTAHPGSTAIAVDTANDQQILDVSQQILADGPLHMMCYCAGTYREMRATEMDLPQMLHHIEVNYAGVLKVLHAVLPTMIAAAKNRQAAHISMVSSVAGFSGLPKSLAYGPTKAALINLAETLYLDLHDLGMGVSVINPGFVDTPLTQGNAFDMPALITPETAANAMLEGWAQGAFEIHYPKRFTLVMKLLRLLPYRLYFPAVRRFTGL